MQQIKYHIKDISQARLLIRFVIFDMRETKNEDLNYVSSRLQNIRNQLESLEDRLLNILEK